MGFENLERLRNKFVRLGVPVSEIEFTLNNFDDFGNLIKDDVPTITTDFCEIGFYDKNVYFVFILDSETFSTDLFNDLQDFWGVKIYGFRNFMKNFYPSDDFSFESLLGKVREEKYFQVQLDFEDKDEDFLLGRYLDAIEIFSHNNALLINQLEKSFES